MKNILWVMIIALVGLSGPASAQSVKYNFDRNANFSKYKTYKWVRVGAGVAPDQLLDKQIMAAIDSQLASKGLTQVDGENADLLVDYQIAIDKETQLNTYGGGGWNYWGGGMTTATTSTINVGTLVIDISDPAAKDLIWRGTGTKTLNPSGNPKKNEERLQKSIAKIFKNYPPKIK